MDLKKENYGNGVSTKVLISNAFSCFQNDPLYDDFTLKVWHDTGVFYEDDAKRFAVDNNVHTLTESIKPGTVTNFLQIRRNAGSCFTLEFCNKHFNEVLGVRLFVHCENVYSKNLFGKDFVFT